MPTPAYIPNASDAVWLEFDTQAGHEKAGHRPALVVSPANYNRKTGLMVCCPMSTKSKAHPFEVVTQVIRSNVLVQNGLGLHHLGSRLCAHCDPFERLLNWQEYFFSKSESAISQMR
ncbi:type II toxin-antitoxin system PemK/MazF family toxin [Limnohabitans sp. Rim8]|uniref:type II toxin-antitoxin system PemK/MazF family toxin n=1 Tax=Limnohabitans sp. Rim8 TaxID=1100718 RepID=UPI002625CEB7|nr:type II toxin-antitoxin system PemK/MazF family toxin [Limnohabitans sp. Rim8]